jgi:hypothetical protein
MYIHIHIYIGIRDNLIAALELDAFKRVRNGQLLTSSKKGEFTSDLEGELRCAISFSYIINMFIFFTYAFLAGSYFFVWRILPCCNYVLEAGFMCFT